MLRVEQAGNQINYCYHDQKCSRQAIKRRHVDESRLRRYDYLSFLRKIWAALHHVSDNSLYTNTMKVNSKNERTRVKPVNNKVLRYF